MSINFDLAENNKKMNELFKGGKTLPELANEKPKVKYEEIPCNACQGGGCPTCNGYGYYYGDKIVEVPTSSPLMNDSVAREKKIETNVFGLGDRLRNEACAKPVLPAGTVKLAET